MSPVYSYHLGMQLTSCDLTMCPKPIVNVRLYLDLEKFPEWRFLIPVLCHRVVHKFSGTMAGLFDMSNFNSSHTSVSPPLSSVQLQNYTPYAPSDDSSPSSSTTPILHSRDLSPLLERRDRDIPLDFLGFDRRSGGLTRDSYAMRLQVSSMDACVLVANIVCPYTEQHH